MVKEKKKLFEAILIIFHNKLQKKNSKIHSYEKIILEEKKHAKPM
jgi:hypothetical protein